MGPEDRVRLGKAAEHAAARFLEERHGYQILARNVRGRRGEIDLVARDGATIVFVEVKARRAGAVSSLEAVDALKRRRLVRAALEYMAVRRLVGVATRFDVAAVALDAHGAPAEVYLVKDAFSAGE